MSVSGMTLNGKEETMIVSYPENLNFNGECFIGKIHTLVVLS